MDVRYQWKNKKNRHRQETPGKRKKRSAAAGMENSLFGKILADVQSWAAGEMERLCRMDWKRLLLLNFPYVVAVYLFDQAAWLYSRCPGETPVEKSAALFMNLSAAFEHPFPSMRPRDLAAGIAGAAAVKAAVYFKGKNAKKFRHGVEYGSARWGA